MECCTISFALWFFSKFAFWDESLHLDLESNSATNLRWYAIVDHTMYPESFHQTAAACTSIQSLKLPLESTISSTTTKRSSSKAFINIKQWMLLSCRGTPLPLLCYCMFVLVRPWFNVNVSLAGTLDIMVVVVLVVEEATVWKMRKFTLTTFSFANIAWNQRILY